MSKQVARIEPEMKPAPVSKEPVLWLFCMFCGDAELAEWWLEEYGEQPLCHFCLSEAGSDQ
jgi:hypothetical protein